MLTLEQQVVSLELARKMKELGFPQESLFYWKESEKGEEKPHIPYIVLHNSRYMTSGGIIIGSAYTTGELGEWLPWRLRDFVLRAVMNVLDVKKNLKQWELAYWEEGYEDEVRFEIIAGSTEADARAKMLIYLAKKGLLDTKTLG